MFVVAFWYVFLMLIPASYVLSDDPTCEISDAYEETCCPFADAECAFCPDGLENPDSFVDFNGDTITCSQLADAEA
eukprot:scaffold439_cov88-Cylindrotheca_fusiformis.AAC.2